MRSYDPSEEQIRMVVEIHCADGTLSISSIYAPVSSDFLREYVPMMIAGVKDLAKFTSPIMFAHMRQQDKAYQETLRRIERLFARPEKMSGRNKHVRSRSVAAEPK